MQRAATKKDWKTCPMPEKNESFIFDRSFSEEEMGMLKLGYIPQEMEDKWFGYMEEDTLHIHRSWTGFCIYIVKISEGDKHSVVANRDPEQHRNNSVEEDMKVLNRLLDWWCKPEHRVMSCQIKTSKAGE